DFALPEVGKKYVWAITPFDDQGRKICDGMGMSTPYNFSIMSIGLPKGYTTPVTGTPSIIALLSPSNGSTYTLWTDEVSDTYKRKNKDSIWFSDEASLRRKDKDSTHHGFTDAEIVFNWRDDSATLQTNYTLRIVKIEKRQTALQAMQDNTAVFEAKDINSDSYTVLKKLPNGDSSINFAWQVSNGESKSEVGTFKGMISDTGYNTTGSTAPLRAPYISFIAQESNVTSALSYKLLITNNDSGSINTPQGIKISLNNDSIISIDDNLSKDWKRTPSTFPPGTGGVLWINNIGKIPTGETNLGNVQFGIPSNNSIYVAYEWLDKSGKTMYKDSVIIDVNNEVNRNKITAISPTYKNPTENLSPTFSWTYNNPNDKIPYSFRLFKLNPEDYKNTFNAMKNNKPVYSIDDITTTSLQYPANIPPLVNGEVYVWNVQPSSLQEMKHFEVFVGGNTRILAAEDCENCKNCTGKCVWDEKCNCFCYVTLPTDPHPMGTFIISKGKTPDTCIFRKK
ncbi:MAG: hypothetical protein NTU43_02435, partial [Bacteroidetes bacterium]|nr:hypothetical protein [Bacteroidota bacterium]